jgi:uncharacterized protein
MDSTAPVHPADVPGLSEQQAHIVRGIYDFVEKFFQNPKFDASHDFKHVLRVVTNAIAIYKAERAAQPNLSLFTIILGALLHDVEDKKYISSSNGTYLFIETALMDLGFTIDEAVKMEMLVANVSYSNEVKNPDQVQRQLKETPELAVVQDADRLDAIGAIGIGRCFAFGGAKGVKSLDESVQHFHDKLYKLEGMMKTLTGKTMAAERSRRLHEFASWWKSEMASLS